ncbi:hypothetical protein SAMN05216325_103140 [Nitrosomonas marina]|uniref:Uncharacterized protein n=1 Tax=Nitrosomonas marina TaxID=917 RepID=A0A1H8BVS0_9PROT|nr:hypothetical protein SAMN05216325_103140 [Nitrosomonas marina]
MAFGKKSAYENRHVSTHQAQQIEKKHGHVIRLTEGKRGVEKNTA